MLGRFSADAAWTSRSHRAKAGASLATESGRNFSTTKRCSRNSSALYHAHPASAKAFEDAVMRYGLADPGGGIIHWRTS
jgi:hypothetical protein